MVEDYSMWTVVIYLYGEDEILKRTNQSGLFFDSRLAHPYHLLVDVFILIVFSIEIPGSKQC